MCLRLMRSSGSYFLGYGGDRESLGGLSHFESCGFQYSRVLTGNLFAQAPSKLRIRGVINFSLNYSYAQLSLILPGCFRWRRSHNFSLLFAVGFNFVYTSLSKTSRGSSDHNI